MIENFGRIQKMTSNIILNFEKVINDHSFKVMAGYLYEGGRDIGLIGCSERGKINYGVVQKHAYIYNTGVMIQSAVRLYKITGRANFLADVQSLAEGSYQYYVTKTNDEAPYIENLPWFVVVLFLGYKELFEIDNNPKYIRAIMTSAGYDYENARDSDGLFYKDWSGRNIQKGQPKWLLDVSCMIELYAHMAILEREYNIVSL